MSIIIVVDFLSEVGVDEFLDCVACTLIFDSLSGFSLGHVAREKYVVAIIFVDGRVLHRISVALKIGSFSEIMFFQTQILVKNRCRFRMLEILSA